MCLSNIQGQKGKVLCNFLLRLYEEAILVPYQARLSVFCRENFPRAWIHTIRIYCMTDDKAEKVIQSLHGFRPLVISGDVEITHSSPIAVRLGGNLMQLRQDPFTSEIYPTSTLRLLKTNKS